jgi:Flp pilus assembly protein TadD
MKAIRTLALTAAVVALLLAACAAPAGRSSLGSEHITTAMLFDASPLAAEAALPDVVREDILTVTPEMSAFLDEYIEPGQYDYSRLKRLLYALMGEGGFELVYDGRTGTAQETFRDRQGNCLSFTNLFVAMARHAGLDAHFQEVDIPADWSMVGESFLLSQHVNVFLDLGHDQTRIVDFNLLNFNTTYERRVVSDARARAHYYNNIGAEQMLSGESLEALANFRASVLEDQTFAPAWINLGILHRREGYPAWAEAAYLQALAVDNYNLVAMSNIANLYEEQGLVEQAAAYRARVDSHRNRNPYYRYYLASEAFMHGDYDAAIEHAKYAIRKRDDEPRFYSLLSLSYLMSGDKVAARRWMAKAEAVSQKPSEQKKYGQKLDWLRKQASSG